MTLLGEFSERSPLHLPACGYADFGLYHAAPVAAGGVALLGEPAKLVPIAVAFLSSQIVLVLVLITKQQRWL